MQASLTPGALKALRRKRGRFQRTFQTPPDRLPLFAKGLLTEERPLDAGSITVEQVVFSPSHLDGLLKDHGLALEVTQDWTITAGGQEECEALLAAALADWLDFYFLPEPNRFLLYADHDEYTTIFAARKGHLSRVAARLADAGFTEVAGYVRPRKGY